MTRVRVRLDSRGIAEVMQSAGMTAVTTDAANKIANGVRAQGRTTTSEGQQSTDRELPVDVQMRPASGTGNIRDRRAMGLVTITHPAGLGMQAKHGVLTRPAQAIGAEVHHDVE